MPEHVVDATSDRYRTLFRRLTGIELEDREFKSISLTGIHRTDSPKLLRMFREAKNAAPPPDSPDPLLFGQEKLQPVIELALRYCQEQDLLPRELSAAEVWEG